MSKPLISDAEIGKKFAGAPYDLGVDAIRAIRLILSLQRKRIAEMLRTTEPCETTTGNYWDEAARIVEEAK